VPVGELRTLAQAVGESIKLVLSNLRLQVALRDQAIRDPLTGLFNRRYLDESLPREILGSGRRHESLMVVMLGIDGFKEFRDGHGHEAGEQALRALSGLLDRFRRAGDIACRYGGEEFALMLPDTSLEEARSLLEGLRLALAELRLHSGGVALPGVSVSSGIAVLSAGDPDAPALLARAAAALSQARTQGGNEVVVAVPE
jgi:diguanylate cyclase (GGDEF)-like protein